jgi:cytochrome P450
MTTAVTTSRPFLDLPGPRGLPILGNMHQIDLKRLNAVLEDWADEYGSVYRFRLGNRDALVVADVDAAHGMLRQRPDRFRRLSAIETVFEEMGINGVFSTEGDTWRRLRRLAMQGLNAEYLRQYFATITRVTDRLRDRWLATTTDVDVLGDLMKYTVDVTAALNLGYDLNTLGDDSDPLQARLGELFPMINRRINAPVPYWRYFRLPADRRVDRALDEINATVREMIQTARVRFAERGGSPADMLEAMLVPQEGIAPFTDSELVGNVITMLLAGQETTASTISWIMHCVTDHPRVQAKMRAEVDAVLGDQVATFEESARLPYVEAVINETLRVHPIAPIIFLETIGEEDVAGVTVPSGTPIFVISGYAAKQDEYFADAATFDPDRWLAEPDIRAFLPFGSGPRYCPGHNLAMLEAKMVMAMAVRNFEITRPPAAGPVTERFAFTLQPAGLALRLVRR